MKRTTFIIPEMDCSCEEHLVRMRLESIEGISTLQFNLPQRHLDVFHEGSQDLISEALHDLNLGARQIAHIDQVKDAPHSDEHNRNPLLWALAINASLFVFELTTGLISRSMGLVADSLDMLADAIVYAISLAAVGTSAVRKKQLAASSGYLQILLALIGMIEVIRRVLYPVETPHVGSMIGVACVALLANAATLWVLQKTTRGEAHIEASWIFTSNDIKVNLLVIAAGFLVWWSSSQLPDLIAGLLIFLIVAQGARRILALAHSPNPSP